jgi:hypothetical protein
VKKVTLFNPPNRITDLVGLKKEGAEVTCRPSFEILPVDFNHRQHRFQAHIFLCRYNGKVDGRPYTFRKCYARGCPYNLCPHVSQAVMIANRYLQRDLKALQSGGIEVETRLFSLDDMVVKFEKLHEKREPALIIHDYINMTREGNEVSIEVELEYVPAVEHFAHHDHAQTFLMGNFAVAVLGRVHPCQRCFACYATEDRNKEKPLAMQVANARLEVLYLEFEQAAIGYQKRFFK